MILNGQLQHGEALRQDRLARDLEVSRTPLRQAFQILDQEGLVEHEGFRGARVRTMTLDVVDDLFEMRAALEPLALQSAFDTMSKLDLAQAEMALDAVDEASSPVDLCDLNWHFHAALYAPCHRKLLLSSIEKLYRSASLASVISRSITMRQTASHSEHSELLALCRSGDRPGAIACLTHHLQHAHRALRESFED